MILCTERKRTGVGGGGGEREKKKTAEEKPIVTTVKISRGKAY